MTKLWWMGILLLSGLGVPAGAGGRGGKNIFMPACPAGQGIEGIVYPVSGNRMPSPNRKSGPSSTPGIKSTVYVFERTNISQVTRQGQTSYYPMINTKLVRQADTDDTGHFKIALPVGHYSVFTRKGDLFYASRRDEKNNIAPVEVVAGMYTRVDCKIEGDRKAVY